MVMPAITETTTKTRLLPRSLTPNFRLCQGGRRRGVPVIGRAMEAHRRTVAGLAAWCLFALAATVVDGFLVPSRTPSRPGSAQSLFQDRSRLDVGFSTADPDPISAGYVSAKARRPRDLLFASNIGFQLWQVYVDQSKGSFEKGGSATLDAFMALAPSSVEVKPAILSRNKLKGPTVRCLATASDRDCFDVANVDSVDKVFRVLTKHMKVEVGRPDRNELHRAAFHPSATTTTPRAAILTASLASTGRKFQNV